MDLHWDADRMLLTTIGSKEGFHVFELDLATKALRQLTPAEPSSKFPGMARPWNRSSPTG